MAREKRRHKRYEVREVRGSLAQNVEAELLNMSLTGLALSAPAMFRVGGKCRLHLNHGGTTLALSAEVKWCRLVQTHRTASGDVVPEYHAGLDFRDSLDQSAKQLLALIESSVVVELERRLAGRFKVTLEDPVQVRTSYEFEVRKISLSGMAIETEMVPEPGKVYDLEIHPDGTPLEARGRIAQVERISEGAERARVGVEFVELSAESRRALEALIEEQLE
jgi:hypothetical protein